MSIYSTYLFDKKPNKYCFIPKNFLSKSIYNLNPKLGDLLIFPNYLMHTAYPFNVDGERRSFSFNAKILFKK